MAVVRKHGTVSSCLFEIEIPLKLVRIAAAKY
jgi:hypothetical protein